VQEVSSIIIFLHLNKLEELKTGGKETRKSQQKTGKQNTKPEKVDSPAVMGRCRRS
jgi:hypothetical protein